MMAESPDYSRSRAVLIGTALYQDPSYGALPAAANSLAGMRKVLVDPDLCTWPDDRVEVWQDPTDMRRLVQSLRRLARGTDGVLLVYFVGHGVLMPRGELCLTLADTDAEDPDITGLGYRWVREALLDSPAHTKIVILDCCYAGRVIEAQASATDIADSTETRGVFTLTASDHTAHVRPIEQQAGVATSFTGEFLDLVRAGIPTEPQWLTLGSLYVHLRHRLEMAGLPAPNKRGTDTADQFSFTRNAAYAPGAGRFREPPSAKGRSGLVPVSPAEVAQRLDEARRYTDRWIHKGGTGADICSLILPECVMHARADRRALLIRLEIIDPTNDEVCDLYARFLRSVAPTSESEHARWTRSGIRKEAFGTILAACWFRQRYALLDIDIGLSSTIATLQWDLQSSCVVLSRDAIPDGAMVSERGDPFYDMCHVEVLTSLEQARRVPLERARLTPLSEKPTLDEARSLFEILELPLPMEFADQDIADVVRAAMADPP